MLDFKYLLVGNSPFRAGSRRPVAAGMASMAVRRRNEFLTFFVNLTPAVVGRMLDPDARKGHFLRPGRRVAR